MVKFIYSEKATNFCKISTVDLSYLVMVKSTVEISQKFLAFSDYMNFIHVTLRRWLLAPSGQTCYLAFSIMGDDRQKLSRQLKTKQIHTYSEAVEGQKMGGGALLIDCLLLFLLSFLYLQNLEGPCPPRPLSGAPDTLS